MGYCYAMVANTMWRSRNTLSGRQHSTRFTSSRKNDQTKNQQNSFSIQDSARKQSMTKGGQKVCFSVNGTMTTKFYLNIIVIKEILFIEWYNLSSIVIDDQDVDSCSGMFFHLLVSSWSLLGFEISVSPTLYLPSRSIHIHSVSHVGIVACMLQPNHLLLDELKCQTWVHVHVW